MNTTDLSSLDSLSLVVIRAVYPWNAAIVFVSVLQLISTILMLVTILSSETLRKNQTFVILAHIAANDAVLAVECLVAGSTKLQAYRSGEPHPSTVRWCLYNDMPRLFSFTSSNGFLFLLALNRLLSVCRPLWFQKDAATRMFTGLMFAMYARTGAHLVLLSLAITDDPVPFCGYLPMNGWSSRLLSLLSILWTTCLVLVYAAALLVTQSKMTKARVQFGDSNRAREQLQVHVVWTLAYILVIHVLTTYVGMAVLAVAGNFSDGSRVHWNYVAFGFAQLLLCLSSVFYFPVMYKRSGEFRNAFGRVRDRALKRKQQTATVGPVIIIM